MTIRRRTLFLLGGLALAGLLLAFGQTSDVLKTADVAAGPNVVALRPPAFVGTAYAEETTPDDFPEDEAGISAYFQASTTINLDDVRDVFRTIEYETDDYIIGSVAVTDYPESEDVHVYVHVDGWVLGYYLADDPVAKIFDWYDYENNGGTDINTKLEKVLAIVAGEAGIPFPSLTYYDFRYPNASHMMLIGETVSDGNDFTVELPSTFSFYERSWGLYNTVSYGSLYLNGVLIVELGWSCYCTAQGTLTAAQLLPDVTHTITVDDFGGLALIYKEP